VEDFSGIRGDETLNLHGFDVRVDEDTEVLHILLINHRPPMDPENGEPLDGKVFGANSTIEHFQTEVGSDTMRHVKTYADPLIQTPNRVAWLTDHSFVFTNYYSCKVGLVSILVHQPFPYTNNFSAESLIPSLAEAVLASATKPLAILPSLGLNCLTASLLGRMA
jgi:hypothetical protein